VNLPVKMEPTECSETSASNIQTPGKYPEENQPVTFLFDWISLLCKGLFFNISSLLTLYSDYCIFGDLNIFRFIVLIFIFVFL
jgi:hypothetical protein